MSEEEKDTVRAAAVQAVKEHLTISDNTRIKTSIGTAASIIATLIGCTVGVTWAVGKYVDTVNQGQARIEEKLNYKVSVSQFKDWTLLLDRGNRKMQPGADLNVPPLPDPPAK